MDTNTVSQSDYENACEENLGWCPDCCAFTRDMTEPDAEGYDCPDCEGHSVMGAENALICGLIDFEDEV